MSRRLVTPLSSPSSSTAKTVKVFSAGSLGSAIAQLLERLGGREADRDRHELGGHDAAGRVAFVLHQLLDVLGLVLLHLLEDVRGLLGRQLLQHVGGVVRLHGGDHVRHPLVLDGFQHLGLLLRVRTPR